MTDLSAQQADYGNGFRRLRKKSLLKYILLSVITLGIYGIVYMYSFTKDVEVLCEGDERKSYNYIIVVLLSIITLGIYYIYWLYKEADRLHEKARKQNLYIPDDAVAIVLLSVLLPLFGNIAAMYMLFDNFNRFASVYNGDKSVETVNSMPKHGAVVIIAFISQFAVFLFVAGVVVSGVFGYLMNFENVRVIIDRGGIRAEDNNFAYSLDDDGTWNKHMVLKIVNNTDWEFVNVEAAQQGSDEWQDDFIDKSFNIKPGSNLEIPIKTNRHIETYDLAFVDSKENIHILYGMKFRHIKSNNPTLILTEKNGELFGEIRDVHN